jgi:hypothetical protein
MDGRDIGARSNAVLQTAMPGHDACIENEPHNDQSVIAMARSA